jgi:hypothetical protein
MVAAQSFEITALAQEATDLVPDWLRVKLALRLASLSTINQDDLAQLIVDLDDPYQIDEVAFTIANLSPELLEYSAFYPQLITENAQLVYDRDEDLNYVELVEVGEPGDADYYTTARYQIVDEKGETVERTIDRDIYYWYLVHPRMEDEYPLYIDPWEACAGGECASNPEDGSLWRAFLWDGAGEECPEGRECPLLSDYVTQEDVLWKSKANDRADNGAIGAIINWQKDAMNFGAGDERPVQPNRIYAVGCGNCGEWADMATAAARTALIPSHNVGAYANDHTWNEFWDDGWKQWEPVNTYVLHNTYYVDGNGDYGRTLDGYDNDCDGLADEGLESQPGSGSDSTEDIDEDGYSVVDGDCDDNNSERSPGATEVDTNRIDDDCDGQADDPDGIDEDGDGYTLSDGDCDDGHSGVYPGAADPALSSNRLFMISNGRGDALIDSDRTDAYGTPAYLEFTVVDDNNKPIDGAIINVLGNWSVYGSPTSPAWAGEGITGPDGIAVLEVGEANPYGYYVTSSAGFDPNEGYYYDNVVEWTEAYETYQIKAKTNGEMPVSPSINEVTAAAADNPVTLSVQADVLESLVESDGTYRGTATSVFGPSNIDIAVFDAENYALFSEGNAASAVAVSLSTSGHDLSVDLPPSGVWYVVAVDTEHVATTAVGEINISASYAGAEITAHQEQLVVTAGGHVAIKLEF